MVNVEKFMADYIAIKQDIDTAQDNAENAVLTMLSSSGKTLSDESMQAIIDVLVKEDIGNKNDIRKFYEQYIIVDNDMVSEVV